MLPCTPSAKQFPWHRTGYFQIAECLDYRRRHCRVVTVAVVTRALRNVVCAAFCASSIFENRQLPHISVFIVVTDPSAYHAFLLARASSQVLASRHHYYRPVQAHIPHTPDSRRCIRHHGCVPMFRNGTHASLRHPLVRMLPQATVLQLQLLRRCMRSPSALPFCRSIALGSFSNTVARTCNSSMPFSSLPNRLRIRATALPWLAPSAPSRTASVVVPFL